MFPPLVAHLFFSLVVEFIESYHLISVMQAIIARRLLTSIVLATLASPIARAADIGVATVSNAVTAVTTNRGGFGGFGGNNAATEKDHQNMMDQLGIKTIRRGADGMNPKSPDYANYDESKANPFPKLPDALTLKNGQEVTTPAMWWNLRRPEIVEDFDREIYGRVPIDTPKVTWEVTSLTRTNNGGVPVITKQLAGHVDNSSYPLISVKIELNLTTPANATGPVPVIMQFGFNFPPGFFARFRGTNAPGGTNRFAGGGFGGNGPTWQQQVVAKGWGYAIFYPTSVQADNGAGLTEGIIGLCNKDQPRKPDDWGALRAWACQPRAGLF
jgi:hypothetical protein